MTAESVSVNHKGERSRSQTARSLVTADELRRMDRGLQIAFIGNLSPAVLRKTPYWKRGALAGRFNPNPYFAGKTPGPGLGERGITRPAQAAGAEGRGTPRVRPIRGLALTARGPQAPKQDERKSAPDRRCHYNDARGIDAEWPKPGYYGVRFTRARSG